MSDFNLKYGEALSMQWSIPEALAQIFETFREQIDVVRSEVVQVTADQLEATWKIEAGNNLKNADGYKQAIHQRQVNETHIVVYNNHEAVWFLELGTVSFDMKRMLDTAKNVKVSKDGNRYIRIPFEGKVKDFIAAGVNEKDLNRMKGTKFVTIKTEGRERNIITAYGSRLKTDAGGRQQKFFSVLNAPRDKFPRADNRPNMGFTNYVTPFKSATTVNYTWTASKYQGAIKMTDFQGKTSGMKTFRTISDASDPNSWIHPGIQASHIAEKSYQTVLPMFSSQMAQAIKPIMDNLEDSMKKLGFT